MEIDYDPLIHPYWLPELKHGLGGPLIKNIWQQPAPKPLATAPGSANLTAKWTPGHAPVFLVPPIALRMGGRLNPAANCRCWLLRRGQTRTANCSIA